MPSGPSMTCRGPCTPRRARNNVFIGAERRLCRGESFPLRQRLRANDGEGRIADRSHRDGIRDLLLAQAEQPASCGVVREGQLRSVVEAAAHEVGVINES